MRMPSSNSQYLIDHLENLALLDGRFTNIKCVNIRQTGDLVGCFSLVFRADDAISKKVVALKFFDISPEVLRDQYRQQCFHREHGLLRQIIGRHRCLQLIADLKSFDLPVATTGGGSVDFPCAYFVVEWVQDSIEHFFVDQHRFTPSEKLQLFADLVLAIEALHKAEIAHRDIKADNFRSYLDKLKRVVVAIDLGCAARAETPNLVQGYDRSAGAPAYSAPEAFYGLAGDRVLAQYTDSFALGALLFELFNPSLFANRVRQVNQDYDLIFGLIAQHVNQAGGSEDARRANWRKFASQNCRGFVAVQIGSAGSSVPPAIRQPLDALLAMMTHPDVSRRSKDLGYVRRAISTCIRVLQNESLQIWKIEQMRKRREARLTKRANRVAKRHAGLVGSRV
jgi:serine/threonine protein kinase